MEKPLKGTVLCCTSVAAEQRSRMAAEAFQMGAEHKLDLTSDVTHLIVGSSNTPKYRYVAREREDIKVLQLEWVEAVRHAWMRGDDVNLDALEEEFRLPTFAGLRICVTGFEDLSFRAQLQDLISANGGDYSGDLTKEVTHLIAHAPEGKKYQFANQWEIKVVGLRWLKDSLHRRMILEETLYHPSISQEKQGIGAWNRQARTAVQLGKRNREEASAPEAPRKLRRTASAKLGSQSESLWGQIVSGPPAEQLEKRDPLRPSKSLPVIKAAVMEPKSFATDTTGTEDDRSMPVYGHTSVSNQQRTGMGIFSGLGLFLHGFTAKQTSILQNHIISNDGVTMESLASIEVGRTSNIRRVFVIVPYCHPFSDMPSMENINPQPEIVTDMWAERCLQAKLFLEPDQHALSRPIRIFPIPGFERLAINSTGIGDIDLLHVSKVVNMLGAKYDQVLKPGISLLLCNKTKAGQEKLRHAQEWRIPVVSIEWLWSCIRLGKIQSFHPFILSHAEEGRLVKVRGLKVEQAVPEEGSEGMQTENPKNIAVEAAQASIRKRTLSKQGVGNQISNRPAVNAVRGEGFIPSPRRKEDADHVQRDPSSAQRDQPESRPKQEVRETDDHSSADAGIGAPLQDVSIEPPPKPDGAPPPPKAPLFRNLDSQTSGAGNDQDHDTPIAPDATSTGKTAYLPPQAESINGAIQELLCKGKAKNTPSSASNGESRRMGLLGRALSNMSNSSREGANVRTSRASSIDSVNTDGLGSVILDETSQHQRANSTGSNGRPIFTGRASVQERAVGKSLLELGDAALYREEYREEEAAPQLTQLRYDNPEEAMALREMLAQRRRERTRRGQEDVKAPGEKAERKIKDVTTSGRGTGRRTRQTAKSP